MLRGGWFSCWSCSVGAATSVQLAPFCSAMGFLGGFQACAAPAWVPFGTTQFRLTLFGRMREISIPFADDHNVAPMDSCAQLKRNRPRGARLCNRGSVTVDGKAVSERGPTNALRPQVRLAGNFSLKRH